MKIFYFGTFDPFNLESSYLRAGKSLGHDTHIFDYNQAYQQQIPYGRIGTVITRFLEVHQWLHQMNRKAIIEAVDFQPDLFLVFCNAKIIPGTLLYLKSVLPHTRFVLIWPDALNNMQTHIMASARLFDLLASYSSTAVPVLQQAGFKNVQWVPLAGDPELHPANPSLQNTDFEYDVSFVGNWRPEREQTLVNLLNHFGKNIRLGVFGPSWSKRTLNKTLRNLAVSRAVFGEDMATIFQKSKINLNRIDPTNYPAANMRFFEIPTAGGLMLSSPCPEMAQIFKDSEASAYFEHDGDLIKKVVGLLESDTHRMRSIAHEILLSGHTYRHRLEAIIQYL